MFKIELDFFIQHQRELVEKYKDKVLAIKGDQILGAYDSPLEAYEEAQKQSPLGSFMIQPVAPGTDAFTVTINSAIFAPAG